MKERPILFSGPMVKAILEGRKTQTRRVVKPNATNIGQCPYGKPCDRLWVRETFFTYGEGVIHYRADGDPDIARVASDCGLWQPSIHMPRWASRLTLEITEVRVQRVQDISEQDCRSEGTGDWPWPICKDVFAKWWNQLNDKREGCAWSDNPWVFVIEFKRIDP